MPKRARNRVVNMPAWAVRLRDEHEAPPRDSDDWSAFIGWRFFGEFVPGLPDGDSREGYRMVSYADKT